MAIFKILKGAKSRIDTKTTAYHEGYAYFTPEDAGFYIDAEGKRIQINPGDKEINTTLSSSGWQSKSQTLSIPDVGSDSKGIIAISSNATTEQFKSAKAASLYISAQSAGSITVTARDTVPTVNIPVTLVLFV